MVATTEVYMDKQEKEASAWLKRHADTVVILAGILGSFLWMTGKFNDIDKRFADVDRHFNAIEQRLVRIETVMVIKGIMSPEIAAAEKK
jgi:hypothetical protein